jgi:hypothetical protein
VEGAQVTDQAVLARAAEKDLATLRIYSARRVADQVLLTKFSGDKNPDVRNSAAMLLTNQAVLAKIAVEDQDPRVRAAAVEKVTDPTLLAKLKDVAFSADIPGYTGDMSVAALNTVQSVARMRLALQDPTVSLRIPKAEFDIECASTSQAYGPQPGLPSHYVAGEYIRFTVTQASRILAEDNWSTEFPHSVSDSTDFIPAWVDVVRMSTHLFGQPQFTQEDILKLAQSPITEVHKGASANLIVDRSMDQAVLTKIAEVADDIPKRQTAVEMLTNQSLLAKIAIEDDCLDIRLIALQMVTDETLLAKIALETVENRISAVDEHIGPGMALDIMQVEHEMSLKISEIRQAAVKKLTDQGLLAKVAVEGKQSYTRVAAVKKLTDQTVLTRIAVEDADSYVRETAIKCLAQLRANGH